MVVVSKRSVRRVESFGFPDRVLDCPENFVMIPDSNNAMGLKLETQGKNYKDSLDELFDIGFEMVAPSHFFKTYVAIYEASNKKSKLFHPNGEIVSIDALNDFTQMIENRKIFLDARFWNIDGAFYLDTEHGQNKGIDYHRIRAPFTSPSTGNIFSPSYPIARFDSLGMPTRLSVLRATKGKSVTYSGPSLRKDFNVPVFDGTSLGPSLDCFYGADFSSGLTGALALARGRNVREV